MSGAGTDRRRRTMLFCAAAATLLYLPALAGGFVWDDALLVTRAVTLPASEVLGPEFWIAEDGSRTGYLRPVTSLLYLADAAVWGGYPLGFHLTNLLLYAGVIAGFVAWARRRASPTAAAGAGALFAAAAIHVEPVAWIAGRTDLLAAMLLLGAMIALERGRGKGVRSPSFLLAAALFVASLGAKETAAVFPLIAAVDLLGGGRDRPRAHAPLAKSGVLAALLVGWLLIRWLVLAPFSAGVRPLPDPAALLAIPALVGKYLGLILFPWRVVPLDRAPFQASHLAIGWAGAVAAALALLRGRRGRAYLYPVAGFLLFLMPAANIVPLPQSFAARFLFLPSLFLFLAAAILVDRLRAAAPGVRVAAAALLVALFAANAVVTFDRVPRWRNDGVLFTWMAETAPWSPTPLVNLGISLAREGRVREAAAAWERAAAREETPRVRYLLGLAGERLGDLPRAVSEYRRAIELDPRSADALYNLGLILFGRGEYAEAAALWTRAEEITPGSPDLLVNLAAAYERLGQHEQAAQYRSRLPVGAPR